MPFKQHRFLSPEGELGLWHITEEESYFIENLNLNEKEMLQLKKIKGHRRVEWLASRWLLHLMSGRNERGACLKDEFGKPYLENSFFEISLSHSRELTAVMASPRLVGVDIQKFVEKILRIEHKFMSDEERARLSDGNRVEALHVYWGAKEALYKAYGRKELDFKKHIFIDGFDMEESFGSMNGRVLKDDYEAEFLINFEKIDDFMLVYAQEDLPDDRIA